MSIEENIQRLIANSSKLDHRVSKTLDENAKKNKYNKTPEDRVNDEHEQRMEMAKKMLSYLKCTTVLVIAVIIIQIFDGICFLDIKIQKLDPSVNIALLTTFFAHVVGLMGIVLHYLYNKPK